jgi:ATP-binding cassette subfamily B protein
MRSEPEPEEPGLSPLDLDEPEQDDNQSLDSEESSQPISLRLSPEDSVNVGWRAIAQVAAIGLAEAFAIVATTLLLRSAIDNLVASPSTASRLVILVGALIAVALFGAWVRWMEFSVAESIGYRYVNRLRMVMYTHLQRIPGRQLLNISRGGILLRFTGDLAAVRTWVSRGIAMGFVASMALIAGIGILVVLDPLMALVVVGILGVGFGLSIAAGARVRRATRAVRRQRANLTTNLTEQIHGMATVQAMGRTSGEYDRLERQSARLTKRLIRYAWVRGWLRALSAASGSLAVIAVVVVGAFSVDAGRTTIGTVVAAMTLARYMIRPIRILGISYDYSQSARISREKIIRFLRHPYREEDSVLREKLRVRHGHIEFRSVSLAGSLNDITAEVKPSQIVAIMGPNGAGKTSLLSIVARIADPDAGEVLVDDQVLGKCSLRSCAAQISLMSSDLPLLRGSLRRNLLYRWRDAPESELERVIELCAIREVIAHFPEGLAAGIKEDGANLSAGHAARVSLARALVGNPKILLLDEPTLNLDAATKRIFRETLLHYGGTVLLVTHDPEEAAIADVVWQMEAGRIVSVFAGKTFRESIAKPVGLPPWARAEDRR